MGATTIDEYDASANATISNGVRFEYIDTGSGEQRVGYFDRETGLFTALDALEQMVITHFKPARGEIYVRTRQNSTYQS